jgi:cytochrome c peroxidase
MRSVQAANASAMMLRECFIRSRAMGFDRWTAAIALVHASLVAIQPRAAEPSAEAAVVESGRGLFFELPMSDPPGTSCTSCHVVAFLHTLTDGYVR